ncbi:MAG: hypothetical protein H0X03_01125 [Nitrosopumilus sp.]|nr:hypothetical protein [Nitrosopumilus sp.]
MLIKKNMQIIFFLLSYTLIFYNLFIIGFFDGEIYSQYPNTIIKQNITDKSENNNQQWLYYTDKKENFTTIYPKDWKIVKSENKDNPLNGFITIFQSPKENLNDIFQDNIVISIIKSDKNITDNNNFEIQTVINKLGMKNKDFKLVNISTVDIDDNQTGKSLTYSFENSGIDFKTEQIVSTVNNKIYIFSLLTEQETFEKYSQILNSMLKNLTIGNN